MLLKLPSPPNISKSYSDCPCENNSKFFNTVFKEVFLPRLKHHIFSNKRPQGLFDFEALKGGA